MSSLAATHERDWSRSSEGIRFQSVRQRLNDIVFKKFVSILRHYLHELCARGLRSMLDKIHGVIESAQDFDEKQVLEEITQEIPTSLETRTSASPFKPVVQSQVDARRESTARLVNQRCGSASITLYAKFDDALGESTTVSLETAVVAIEIFPSLQGYVQRSSVTRKNVQQANSQTRSAAFSLASGQSNTLSLFSIPSSVPSKQCFHSFWQNVSRTLSCVEPGVTRCVDPWLSFGRRGDGAQEGGGADRQDDGREKHRETAELTDEKNNTAIMQLIDSKDVKTYKKYRKSWFACCLQYSPA